MSSRIKEMTPRILVFVLLTIAAMLLPPTVSSAPRPPQPPWPQPTLRAYGFDSAYYNVPWDGVAINEDLATLVESFSGYALVREGWLAAPVVIPAASERKKPNVAPSYGSVRFWISPNWSSAGEKFGGNGPGNLARLVELVDFSGKKPVLRWSLYVNETGDAIYLTGQTGQGVKDLLQASVQFEANDCAWSRSVTRQRMLSS